MTTKEPTTELVPAGGGRLAPPTGDTTALSQPSPRPASSLLEVIATAVMDPRVDIAKMKELFSLQREIEHDAAVKSFRAAKARLAARLPQIGRSGQIVHEKDGVKKHISNYAKLEEIDVQIRPLLAEEGFAFSFDSHEKNGTIEYVGELSHRDGHAETKTISVKPDTSGAKNSIQAVGSSTTYARRMLIKMHLNLVERDEDDDGAGGNVAPITKEHAEELRKALADAREVGLQGFAEERWLKWIFNGKEFDAKTMTFDAMYERDFERVKSGIAKKRADAEAQAAGPKK